MKEKKLYSHNIAILTQRYICNLFGIKDSEELHKIEADLTAIRLAELAKVTKNGNFGMTHIKNIHKYVFQDLYPFAGKFRTEDIWKGDTFFCKSEYIEDNLVKLLSKLKDDRFLKNYDRDDVISKLSFYMSELNMIHPFREGNGRVIREFIRQLALNAGYEINWYKIDADTLLKAIISAVDYNMSLLEECIQRGIS